MGRDLAMSCSAKIESFYSLGTPCMMASTKRQRSSSPAARPIDLGYVQTLLDGSVDEFLTINDVLRLRGCDRQLAHQYHPSQSPRLWRRIRPMVNQFHRVAAIMTAAGATMFGLLYQGAAAQSAFQARIREAACMVGNASLIDWYHKENPDNEYAAEDTLRLLCEYGHAEHAERFAALYNVPPRALDGGQYIEVACEMGNIKMAEWLLAFGHRPIASYLSLCIRACVHDNLDCAAWALSIFPHTIQPGMICVKLTDPVNQIPIHAQRWLIEIFDLAWLDVRLVFDQLLNQFDEPDARPDLDWLIARYFHDWAVEYASALPSIKASRYHQLIAAYCDDWMSRR